MKHSIPFPHGGGDWRFDPRTGRLVDASAPAEQAAAHAPTPSKVGDEKPTTTPRKRTSRKS